MINTLRLVGVDPGSNFTGVTVMNVSVPSLEILSIETNLIDMLGFESIYNTDLQYRLHILFHRFKNMMQYYRPDVVTLEYGFINRFRPAAYGPLSQVRAVLEQSVMQLNMDPNSGVYSRLNGYAPSTIKNAVGSKGGSDKITIETAVSNISEISRHIDVKTISEHEIDGIAIAYTQLQMFRSNPHMLLI